MNSAYWFELAVVLGVGGIGNILFAHFEPRASKFRRILKIFVFAALAVTISATAGRPWFFVFIGVLFVAFLVVHAWWLPRNGINGWTAEPRDKYYAFRGWKLPTS